MITSARLLLRPLTLPEAEWALSEAGPPGCADGYPSAFAVEVCRLVALHPFAVGEGPAELGPWSVLRRSDGLLVGMVSCARTEEPSTVSVGYDIAPSCWGQGYATEALRAVLAHLFALPAVWRVCAEAAVTHLASRRVLEKAGLRWLRDERGTDASELAHYAIDRPAP